MNNLFLFAFFTLALVVGLVALLVSMSRSRSLAHRRLDVLEQGLAHPQLDPATREELLRVLAREQAGVAGALSRLLRNAQAWRLAWYGAAWLMFVVGGCMLAARAFALIPGISVSDFLPTTIAGFAMLTLPLALQELGRRHQPSAPGG
jgi:uncharacterized membrane protein YedE/YeeE